MTEKEFETDVTATLVAMDEAKNELARIRERLVELSERLESA